MRRGCIVPAGHDCQLCPEPSATAILEIVSNEGTGCIRRRSHWMGFAPIRRGLISCVLFVAAFELARRGMHGRAHATVGRCERGLASRS
jgi:hypothetical protein